MYDRASKVCLILLFVILLLPSKVLADSVTFSASVGDTTLTFRGFTSATSLVTFIENSSVKGTTVSLADGSFEKTFTAESEGVHSISIYATDPKNHNTSVVQKSIFVIAFQATEINNVILPASMYTDQTSYSPTQNIKISGYSMPDSILEIRIKDTNNVVLKTVDLLSDSVGAYEYILSANNLGVGDYSADITIKDNSGTDIITSSEIQFSIASEQVQPPPVVTPPSEPPVTNPVSEPVGPNQPEGCIYSYVKLCLFDLKQIGYISQGDELNSYLKGFVQYFGARVDNSNPYDINEDGIVSAEDLSIVLHYTNSDATYEPIIVPSNTNNTNSDLFANFMHYQYFYATITFTGSITLGLLIFSKLFLKKNVKQPKTTK